MQQTSLTAWLSKPAGLKAPVSIQPRNNEAQSQDEQRFRDPDPLRESPSNPVPQRDAIDTLLVCGDLKLPPNVELRACTKEDIPHLKRLNSLLLPIPYPEKFYREIIEDPLTNSITLVAVWHDDLRAAGAEKGRLVGAIRCRLLAQPPPSEENTQPSKTGSMLYLSTLVLLSPYRSHGIAASMLKVLIKRAVNDHGVTSVGAHVWEDNVEGLEWYRRRGFKETGREEGYYRRLKPTGAVIVQREVSVMDMIDS